MTIVLDANIPLRIADPTAALYPVAVAARTALESQGHTLRTFEQSVREFWVAATRPRANNGLGLSVPDADREVGVILGYAPLLDDPAGLFAEWRRLVVAHQRKGKPAHDARYVAAMRPRGVSHILTFNTADFARFPGVVALDPAAVAAGRPVP
jgi:hypothetical protein